MPAYSGKFQYLDAGGATVTQGACQLSFDDEKAVVTPASGRPIAFDLGDVDRVAPAEWEMELTLFTGKTLALRQFGPAFGRMSGELLAAWRDRTVRCLLLEDLEEVDRFNGSASLDGAVPMAAEIRLYKTNLAILPAASTPFQLRLADVDSMAFDDGTYSITLESPAGRAVIGKLAKRTDAFRGKLQDAWDALRTQSAEALRETFPFLDPDRLERLLAVIPEGRSASFAALSAIHPKLPDALVARAVDARLRPYFDALRARAGGALLAGFKFIRKDELGEPEEPAEAEETAAPERAPAEEPENPLFFWFFFPIEGTDVVAWEATTGSGRATYFFRARPPLERSAAALTRGLALVNFRREPVYLPDDSLEQQAKFHRYAIGCRKLPDLRALRAAFLGRAIHSTVEKWTAQMDAVLRQAMTDSGTRRGA